MIDIFSTEHLHMMTVTYHLLITFYGHGTQSHEVYKEESSVVQNLYFVQTLCSLDPCSNQITVSATSLICRRHMVLSYVCVIRQLC